MVVEKSTFVEHLAVRGEIRPVRSVVLTAPSSGGDLQIVDLAANGVAGQGRRCRRSQFDSTTQQRTLEQQRSELQAGGVRSREGRSRSAAAGSGRRRGADAAASRRRRAHGSTSAARELVSKVEAEKLALALADAEQQVKAQLEQKLEGERAAAAADVAIARQKRDKAAFDVADTERIIASLTMKAPAAGRSR